MKKIFLSLIMVLVLVANGWSETILNGNQWRKWDSAMRIMYIAGFFGGSSYVVKENQVSFPDDFDSKEEEKAIRLMLEYKGIELLGDNLEDNELKKMKINKNRVFNAKEVSYLLNLKDEFRNAQLLEYAVGHITVNQYVDGLNKLYDDFKNRNINIEDAIYVVKGQIKGMSSEEIEKILLYLRSGKKEDKYLEIKDEKGKTIDFIHFP